MVIRLWDTLHLHYGESMYLNAERRWVVVKKNGSKLNMNEAVKVREQTLKVQSSLPGCLSLKNT